MNEIEIFFKEERQKLSSFIFRMTGSKEDSDDLLQEVMLSAIEKKEQFKGKSSLKTWVYAIASNKTIDFLRKEKRWQENVMDKAKDAAKTDEHFFNSLLHTHQFNPQGSFEVKEHIDLCFSCISRTLPIEKQLALILKDVYEFRVKEIANILEKTISQVKHLLEEARHKMNEIFHRRCALINKNGVCNQCTELNGIFNPQQDMEQKKLAMEFAHQPELKSQQELYALRKDLVKMINPMKGEGHVFQQKHMEFICKIAKE